MRSEGYILTYLLKNTMGILGIKEEAFRLKKESIKKKRKGPYDR